MPPSSPAPVASAAAPTPPFTAGKLVIPVPADPATTAAVGVLPAYPAPAHPGMANADLFCTTLGKLVSAASEAVPFAAMSALVERDRIAFSGAVRGCEIIDRDTRIPAENVPVKTPMALCLLASGGGQRGDGARRPRSHER